MIPASHGARRARQVRNGIRYPAGLAAEDRLRERIGRLSPEAARYALQQLAMGASIGEAVEAAERVAASLTGNDHSNEGGTPA